MITRLAFLAFSIAASAGALTAQIIDRTVAIVDTDAITESEVTLQLRLEALANGTEFVDDEAARDRALDRLIDQRLIAKDVRLTGLPAMSSDERADMLEQLRSQEFGKLSFEGALQKYGVSESEALEFFARQVEFSRYVDFRFRTGQTVDDEALQQAYRAKYGRNPNRDAPSLQVAAPQLRNEVLNQRVEDLLIQHIRQLRADFRVVRLERIDRSALEPIGETP